MCNSKGPIRSGFARSRVTWFALGYLWIWMAQLSVVAAEWIAAKSDWRYFKGTREASTPDSSAWRNPGFNDAGWSVGPAPFFYGEALEGGTVLSDMLNGYTTLYLRHRFHVDDPANVASIRLAAMCDDGFMAWVNGVPVASLSAPTGAPLFSSVATLNAPEPVVMTEYPAKVLTGALRAGENVLAVQVFNVSAGSSDLVFDAMLSGDERETVPPTVSNITPPAGVVSSLTNITVEFSEPVRGVSADDLFINGLPAKAVTGSGRVYSFAFDQPPVGSVQVSWNVAHGINDLATPSNLFNGDAPTSIWRYTIADADAPLARTIRPGPNTVVGRLSQAEVLFSEIVEGVQPTDLRMNGKPARTVTGGGAGPYVFEFETPLPGRVQLGWSETHSIKDLAGNALAASGWQTTYDPNQALPDLVINEIMCENGVSLKDDEQDTPDWIEIHNRGTTDVSMAGFSLTDDDDEPGQWVFPAITVRAGQYLVVFASGKDRGPKTASGRWHTNFKLGEGEYVGLYSPDTPRRLVSELKAGYPAQRPDYSYGRDPNGRWRYYQRGTPGFVNPESSISEVIGPVHFSATRGYYDTPFDLSLASRTPGSVIRFTTDGSLPSLTNGTIYATPIRIESTRVIRAAAFGENMLPSEITTHTYLYGLPQSRRYIPAMSITTATNNLYGASGIMESNPRNTTKHGILWERPVSVEYLRPDGLEGFAVDAGLRVQGGAYIRTLYNYRSSAPPTGKYSFRLYFRGDYGAGRLNYPLIPGAEVGSYDSLVLRAGMNDPTNPFVADELVRRLAADTGQPASRGTFVHLFINGQYKGYYNPTERIDVGFLQSHHGTGDKWDEIAQGGEVREGDSVEWNALRTLVSSGKGPTDPATYTQIAKRLDLVNFIDYLLPNIYGGTGDWPHNNWRSARERAPGGAYRFYIWDAEWSFENQGRSVSNNTLTTELGGDSEIATFYKRLRLSQEFRQLFADRIHKHFFNGGALTDERIKQRADQLRAEMGTTISGFRNPLTTSWTANRRKNIMNHFNTAKLFMSSNAPAFAQFGGRVPRGFSLVMTNLDGQIFFTTDGSDPRVPFAETVSTNAVAYIPAAPPVLDQSVLIQARTLSGTNWSALTAATFQVMQLGSPLRITELMYNAPGGDAYEFLELSNTGTVPVAMAGLVLSGVDYRFADTAPALAPGARIILASPSNPALFAQRYPGVSVYGTYTGALSAAGEKIVIKDRNGAVVTSVDYGDDQGWPTTPDGGGYSLEWVDANRDPNDPNAWQASTRIAGTPGAANSTAQQPLVLINELVAENVTGALNGGKRSDWLELYNPGASAIDLTGWSLSDGPNPRRYVFPAGSRIAGNGYLVVWADTDVTAPGLHTGFGLGKTGDALYLYNTSTNRIDGVRFGPQIADHALARFSGTADGWALATPTPGTANVKAALGSVTSVLINEFLANAIIGEPDWIELYNPNAQLPVDLHGSYVRTASSTYQILSHVIVGPKGYVQLFADEGNGPTHLDFKLPSAGGSISLSDATGATGDQLTYITQLEGVTEGRLPDGAGSIVRFPSSATPGAANVVTAYSGPVFNEILANPIDSKLPNGGGESWIELHNSGTTVFDLSGMSVSIGEKNPGQWTFPTGSTIAAGGYMILRCDATTPESKKVTPEPNLGRALSPLGGSVFLFNTVGQDVDSIAFGFQLGDQSIGRSTGTWQLQSTPTPGRLNGAGATLGAVDQVRFNEWMAAPSSGGDWLELFNATGAPVNLGGLTISDDPSIVGRTNFVVTPLSFIPAGGWVRFEADGNTNLGPNHLSFSLDELGESLRLYGLNQQLIDAVDFGSQGLNVSSGRFPDGSSNIRPFPDSASPGAQNFATPEGLVVNELLAHTDPPVEDAVEFQNTGAVTLDLSGWYLSNAPKNPKKYRLPQGSVIAPGQFLVIYEQQFNATNTQGDPFTFNSSQGDEIVLSSADASGNLTGFRLNLAFPASENRVSFGRHKTSLGTEFVAMSGTSFGVDAPESLSQFRAGRGMTNPGPKIGPAVVSEIYYSPTDVNGSASLSEFIELHNPNTSAVALYDPENPQNTWKLQNAVEFVFPTFTVLGAGEYLVVVDFDPVTEPTLATTFRQRFGVPERVVLMGPFKGRLNNQGETVELYKPDPPQRPPHPDAGFVPYILVERIRYTSNSPWAESAARDGFSLQRKAVGSYANDPVNWGAGTPTPGAKSAILVADLDLDKDGMLDDWERTHGLNPLDPTDAAQDSDGDGLSNLNEYLTNTDPRSGNSRFAVNATLAVDGSLALEFAAAAGRSYEVQRRDQLGEGIWQTDTMVDASNQDRQVRLIARRSGFYRVICTFPR